LFPQGLAYDSLDKFLVDRKANPTNHYIIGNDAADADSIISAITLAYIESKHGNEATPVVPISKEAFTNERPEINLLLDLAGISNAPDELLFIDDLVDILADGESKSISLVDHNTLNKSLQNYQETLAVVEIVDHHKDTHQYEDTCAGKQRNIAFKHNHALVASTTTLVAERLREYESPPYSASIGILLLGVILLDSVDLDDSIGKVTDRDRESVNDLLINTDWNKAKSSSYLIRGGNRGVTVNTNELFRMLQMAKYDPVFWSQMSVYRSLSYDFKYFQAAEKFGISSILMSGVDFMTKEGFWNSTYLFMKTMEISFLGIMFAYYDEQEVFHRQLACVYTTDEDRLVERSDLVDAILTSDLDVDLQLEEVMIPSTEHPNLQARLFDQHNVAPSRKQIGPLLEKLLNG